jgi:phospholipid transport system substrate-binding protein
VIQRRAVVAGVGVAVAMAAVGLGRVLPLARRNRVAQAAGTVTAEDSIRKTVDDAFAVLRDKSLAGGEKRHERIAALRRIADQTFDWSEMARGSLGPGWRAADPAKRARFVTVFKDLLAAQYMDDIDKFEGTEKVTVDGSAREGDATVVKTTLITASREHVPIDYRLHEESGRWMIVDITIESVSLVNHFRKTFSSALANMTVDQLIDRLEKQLPPTK